MLTMHLGPDEMLVNLNVEFDDELDTTRIEQTIDLIESRIREKVPEATQIFIEAEPRTNIIF